MAKTGLFKANDSLIPFDEQLATFQEIVTSSPAAENIILRNVGVALKGGWGIAQSEGHSFLCEGPVRAWERGFLLIFRGDRDLKGSDETWQCEATWVSFLLGQTPLNNSRTLLTKFNWGVVKGNQEKDKIRSKPNKNGKRGEARQCQNQSQSRKQEKRTKYKFKGPKDTNPRSCIIKDQREGLELQFTEGTKTRAKTAIITLPSSIILRFELLCNAQ
nr:hypothetical protein [Tanacetum cinerariifolium]